MVIAGVVWDKESLPEYTQHFENIGCNVLFIDGNHENFDMLNEYPVEYWNGGKIHKISEHTYHLLRGQVFDICGKKFLTIGGADSSDREYREEHIKKDVPAYHIDNNTFNTETIEQKPIIYDEMTDDELDRQYEEIKRQREERRKRRKEKDFEM